MKDSFVSLGLALLLVLGFSAPPARAMGQPVGADAEESAKWREQDAVPSAVARESAGPSFDRGKELYQGGKYKEALREFKRVIQLDPTHPWAQLYVERIEERLSKKAADQMAALNKELEVQQKLQDEEMRRAEEDYRRKLEAEKKKLSKKADQREKEIQRQEDYTDKIVQQEMGPRINSLYGEAVSAYRAGNYAEALAKFEAVLTLDPGHKKAARYKQTTEERLAKQQIRQGESLAATEVSTLRPATVIPVAVTSAIDAEEIPEVYKEAVSAYRSQDYAGALAKFDAILGADPGHKKAAYYKQATLERLDRQGVEAVQPAASAAPPAVRVAAAPAETTPVPKSSSLSAAEMALRDQFELLAQREGELLSMANAVQGQIDQLDEETSFLSPGQPTALQANKKRRAELEAELQKAQQGLKEVEREKQVLSIKRKALERRLAEDYRQDLESGNVPKMYAEGRRLYKAGDFEAAKDFFVRVVEIDPQHRAAQKYLNHIDDDIADQLQKLERERERARQAAEKRMVAELKKREETMFARAKEFYAAGAFPEAREQLERLLDLNPENSAAVDYLNRVSVAEERSERVVKVADAETEEKQERRFLFWKQGKEKEAEEDERDLQGREKALRKEKVEELFLRAKAAANSGDFAEAVETAELALQLDPGNRPVQKFISRTRADYEKTEKRLEDESAKRERQLRAEKTRELLDIGRARFEEGRYQEAAASFEAALRLDPGNRLAGDMLHKSKIEFAKTTMTPLESGPGPDPRYLEGEDLYNQGYYRQALEKFGEVQSDRPDDAVVEDAWTKSREMIVAIQSDQPEPIEDTVYAKYWEDAQINLMAKRYAAALKSLNKVLAQYPEHTDALLARTEVMKELSVVREREARQARLRAMALASERKEELARQDEEVMGVPRDERAMRYITEARELAGKGKYEEAIARLESALAIDPGSTRARSEMARVRRQMREGAEDDAFVKRRVPEEDLLLGIEERQVLPQGYDADGIRTGSSAFSQDRGVVRLTEPLLAEDLSQPVSLDFQEVPLEDILRFLVQMTGVNILPSAALRDEGRTMSIRLKDVPLENALEYMFRKENLSWRVEDDAVWVSTPQELESEAVETRIYFLGQGKGMYTPEGGALSEVTSIRDVLEEVVPAGPDSKLVFDDRSSALIVTDTPSNLALVEELLYNIDISPVQVLIESRFTEITEGDFSQLGFETALNSDMKVTGKRDGRNKTQVDSGTGIDFGTAGIDPSSIFSSRGTEGLNLSYQGILTSPQFQVVLHALQEDSKTKTLSTPRVTTLNNQRATIKVVDEYVYPSRYEVSVVREDLNGDGDFEDTVSGVSEVRFVNLPQDFVTRDLGILLHVTPSVGKDRERIALSLVPEVSELKSLDSFTGSVTVPRFTSRNLSTSVIINDGDTVVLGGLITETDSTTKTKVPILGDLPVVGALFSRSEEDVDRSNLVIFVTANILAPDGSLLAKQGEI
ncbi:MAG: tetratricopeptide repeat protein [Candidatus Omnitrophica bacterium]|nr:tetratricopeptide repeat protein [Candidatus Omnitrophota bacterium]